MTDPLKSDLADDPKRIKSHLVYIRQAINNGWDVNPEIKKAILRRLRKMVGDDAAELGIPELCKISETVCKMEKSDMDVIRLWLEANKAEQPDKIEVVIKREGE